MNVVFNNNNNDNNNNNNNNFIYLFIYRFLMFSHISVPKVN